MLRSSTLRISTGIVKKFQRCASSTPNPALTTNEKASDEHQEVNNNAPLVKQNDLTKKAQRNVEQTKVKSNLIASAFATLEHNKNTGHSLIDESIRSAKSSEDLLSLSQNSVLTKKQAVKIVSTLSEWALNGKSADIESDPRFVALCNMVSEPSQSSNTAALKNGDLNVVLGIMSEDEAAKIINTLTLPQMIRVLTSLSFKRRRSIPLLKSIAFNIGRSTPKLDIKQSADILYAVACLNFPDEVLLEKVSGDLLETISLCHKSAVIGSICTSIGLLRYRDVELLDCLCSWVLENKDISRLQDFVSLILCLASVKQVPSSNVIELILTNVTENDVPSAATWLDIVWSLAVLGCVPHSHISSVLTPKFIERLSNTAGSLSINWKRKLLNINGLAKLTKDYKGPVLKEGLDFEVLPTKPKQPMFLSVVDTLSNLFPSSHYYRTSVDTGMGFAIDAECMFDSKLNPVPLIDKKTGKPIQLNGKRKTKKKGERYSLIHFQLIFSTRNFPELVVKGII